MPPAAIAEANHLVQQVIAEVQETAGKKCGFYRTYRPTTVCLQIAKYASNHGVTSAARVFSWRLNKSVSESTVQSIRDAYRNGTKRSQANNTVVPVLK